MMLLNQPGISRPLKTTIALHLYKDLVNTVPFFAGSDTRFLGKVCLALETAVYLPGDTIIYCDDIGKEMFIVRKGLVEILVPDCGDSEKRIYLRDGNFFGETALVIDVRRTNTVRAVNICDLNVLSKHAFNEIAAEYPEFGERMKRTVIKRQLDNMNIQSPTEKAKVHNQLTLVVEKSLKQRRMSVSLRTIYRAKKLGDKLKDIAERASKPVRRMSRAVVLRPARIRPSVRDDSERSFIEPSTRDLAQYSGIVDESSARNLLSKRSAASSNRKNSGLSRQLTHPGAQEPTPDSGRTANLSRRTIDLPPRPGRSVGMTPDPRQLLDLHPGPRRTLDGPRRTLDGPRQTLDRGNGSHRTIDLISRKLSRTELTLDLISRKLSRTELTLDLIPAALADITTMVEQIRQTTELLSLRLGAPDDYEDEGDDFDDTFSDDLALALHDSPTFSPLTEETEEEIARRESNSIVRRSTSRRIRSGNL
ncbi:unnamed protein product [Phytophthora fragariaefolia]|uniref:Unnamed protein product n=1 Tax=Phytophthora fragariaefolia TaxID=1490495 RepID=A0A9W7DAV9_9STRA|nr:unnamed protein product [Phytophthora fragariaefolia]